MTYPRCNSLACHCESAATKQSPPARVENLRYVPAGFSRGNRMDQSKSSYTTWISEWIGETGRHVHAGVDMLVGSAAKKPCTSAPMPAYMIACYTRPWAKHEYRVALDAIAEAGYKYVGLMTTKAETMVSCFPWRPRRKRRPSPPRKSRNATEGRLRLRRRYPCGQVARSRHRGPQEAHRQLRRRAAR